MNPDYVVDPFNITDFERTDAQLEAFALFAVAVAGKKADITSRGIAKFLDAGEREMVAEQLHLLQAVTPFTIVRFLDRRGILAGAIKAGGIGQYNRMARAFAELADRHVRALQLPGLESIHGIGPKTARFFIMHAYPNVEVAALDVHILAHLKDAGIEGVPKVTPPAGKLYRRLEQEFLAMAKAVGKSPAVYDLEIWTERTKSKPAA